ncbi:general odorant-binding protein 45 [Aedes aegypti]|uniref:Uncharacterized protein n=1 Tax=Aedes aegypti TaxID=7159 RepID=A0A6I8U0K7_AEDAE|nr:general odorant-binding protein 45 [Aedes aegypti]
MESKTFHFLLPLLCTLASYTEALDHAAILKSPNELQLECSKYLPSIDVSRNVDCTDRCIGLVGRFWNDSIGRPAQTIARYYQPDTGSQDYITRTDQCLCEKVLTVPRNAYCQRASSGLQCYRDNYGQLLTGTPQFVPVTEIRAAQIFWDCAQMLQISRDRLTQIFKDGYNKTSEGRCLIRCFLVRAGLYSDCQGPNIGRFAVQCVGYTAEYEQAVVSCYDRLKKESLDSCSLATRTMDECIQGNQFSSSDIDGLVTFVGVTLFNLGKTLEGIYYPLVTLLFLS